jgi:hypothetical protein
MQDFEKLGAFYLGRQYDLAAARPRDELLLYDAKDLTTHAVCVGMTGSGKTGLCLALLEEAAIDGIPAIAIDPKGDLGNLLLTFPKLRPEDFRPWIDPGEASRSGLTLDELAQRTATRWREGLAEWGQQPARIERFRASADVAIYTPGASAGLPLALLRSFAAPPAEIRDDADALRQRIAAAVSGLLSLVGIDADPLRSREHILLARILEAAWREGRDVELAALVREIQSPPFAQVGVVDLESFFPAKERFELAMSLNNLLASPGFAAWREGEPLDIGRLLYTREGKPRLSILSIAHLSDAERMFFVTLLLNEVVAWMRTQSGTSSLRALLYMDEVFGYFPPTANPPSKTPMLTLLKQARAFGLGVVLATQNPVDLDYKGLSNAGTWFLGRLQTERDKARVLDGLEGASTAAGARFDRRRTEAILSGLGNRVFLMNNVHEDQPVVFQTRWALSYLRGPLSRDQIETLMAPRKQAAAAAERPSAASTTYQASNATPAAPGGQSAPQLGARPVLPPGVPEFFLPRRVRLGEGESLVYRPALLGTARLHFAQAASDVDEWREITLLAAGRGDEEALWDEARTFGADELELESEPEQAGFASLPSEMTRPKQYSAWGKQLKDHLYRSQQVTVLKCVQLKQTSRPNEDERAFRARLAHAAREARDEQVEKLRAKYTPKLASLGEQIRKAQQRVEREKSQANQQTLQTAISFGASILGALMGRKLASATNIGRAATSMRSASRAARERADIGEAQESVEALQQRLAELDAQFKAEVDQAKESISAETLELEPVAIRPKKSEISVTQVALVWTPWKVDSQGLSEPSF